MYTPKEHEELFDVKPVGVKYICEFCNKGESTYSSAIKSHNGLYPHICDHCNKVIMLPKIYPYIEWNEKEEG